MKAVETFTTDFENTLNLPDDNLKISDENHLRNSRNMVYQHVRKNIGSIQIPLLFPTLNWNSSLPVNMKIEITM